LNIWIFFS